MSTEEKARVLIGCLILGLSLVGIVSLSIFYARANESCLVMGFDKYRVTWNFRVFCVGYDGVLRPVTKEVK